jgi:hypothetical protein
MTDINADKQKLKPHEYAWAGWPLIMVFIGGALGGLCGGAAMALNVKIFNSSRSVKYKYGMTLLVSLASILIYIVAVTILVLFFPSIVPKQ